MIRNWPEDWTPLDAATVRRLDDIADNIAAALYPEEFPRTWVFLLFGAWRHDEIDLGGYFDVPVADPKAPIPVLHYPRSERNPLFFAMIRPNRWRHQQTGRLIYDIHFRRARQSAEAASPATVNEPGQLAPPDLSGLGVEAARIRLLEAAWEAHGRPPEMTAKQAADAGPRRWGERRGVLTKTTGTRVTERAWSEVRRQHHF